MSLDYYPTPSGGRDELHYARFTTALRAWHNSSSKPQFTMFLKLGSHYQRVSLNIVLLPLYLSVS